MSKAVNQFIASFFYVLFITVSVYAEAPKLKKEAYRIVQIIPEGEDHHCDGANLIRYPAYSIYTTEGKHVLNVPESYNKPHSFKILPGTYSVEFTFNGKTQKVLMEVDNESFQRFKL